MKFWGSSREVTKLKEIFGEERLINVTGPPGTGKTYLAAKLMTEIDKVAFVLTEKRGRRRVYSQKQNKRPIYSIGC
jgi:broad-specificity NMP kinase